MRKQLALLPIGKIRAWLRRCDVKLRKVDLVFAHMSSCSWRGWIPLAVGMLSHVEIERCEQRIGNPNNQNQRDAGNHEITKTVVPWPHDNEIGLIGDRRSE